MRLSFAGGTLLVGMLALGCYQHGAESSGMGEFIGGNTQRLVFQKRITEPTGCASCPPDEVGRDFRVVDSATLESTPLLSVSTQAVNVLSDGRLVVFDLFDILDTNPKEMVLIRDLETGADVASYSGVAVRAVAYPNVLMIGPDGLTLLNVLTGQLRYFNLEGPFEALSANFLASSTSSALKLLDLNTGGETTIPTIGAARVFLTTDHVIWEESSDGMDRVRAYDIPSGVTTALAELGEATNANPIRFVSAGESGALIEEQYWTRRYKLIRLDGSSSTVFEYTEDKIALHLLPPIFAGPYIALPLLDGWKIYNADTGEYREVLPF